MFGVRGADEREIRLIRDRKDDPPIFALEEIRLVMVEQPLCHDVGAADQPNPFCAVQPDGVFDDILNPRAARVDQPTRGYGLRTIRSFHRDRPVIAHTFSRHDLGAGHDPCATLFCITRVQDDKPRILYPAVGIFVSQFELGL